jgi:succinate dehydrogenase / fumarate reductase, iron-sulfur subunit
MELRVKIFRFNPENDAKPHYDVFEVEAEGKARLLDVLEQIRAEEDPSLAFRRSCGQGMCGSDAFRINGRNQLACKTLVRTFGKKEILVEPLAGLKVIKDLIVDLGPFFEQMEAMQPVLINAGPLPENGKERIQTPHQFENMDEGTRCILCAACTTACPSFWAGKYIGPAAIVNAYRFIFDSRDQAFAQRLALLNQTDGVWRCRTVFNCTEACPRDIRITQLIVALKRKLR